MAPKKKRKTPRKSLSRKSLPRKSLPRKSLPKKGKTSKPAAKSSRRAAARKTQRTKTAVRAKARPARKKSTPKGRRVPPQRLDAEDAELLNSLKKNPRHHRLPPNKRHEVEEDERVEREGEPGRVFVDADTEDEEAQQLGEEFVRSVTSGEEAESEMEEEAQVEEQGGPFVITTAREEFAYDSDESNPPGTEREPFPRVSLPVRPKAD